MKMCNNLLWSMEKQQIPIVIFLELSAAFDMVDNNILLNIIHNHYGITDNVLQRFNNYLQPWYFKAGVGNNYSRPQQLHFSVPRDLVAKPTSLCIKVL